MQEWVRLIETAADINAVNIRVITAVSYADDGLVAARDPVTNTSKMEVIVFCHKGSGRGSARTPTSPGWTPITENPGRGGRAECHVCRVCGGIPDDPSG